MGKKTLSSIRSPYSLRSVRLMRQSLCSHLACRGSGQCYLSANSLAQQVRQSVNNSLNLSSSSLTLNYVGLSSSEASTLNGDPIHSSQAMLASLSDKQQSIRLEEHHSSRRMNANEELFNNITKRKQVRFEDSTLSSNQLNAYTPNSASSAEEYLRRIHFPVEKASVSQLEAYFQGISRINPKSTLFLDNQTSLTKHDDNGIQDLADKLDDNGLLDVATNAINDGRPLTPGIEQVIEQSKLPSVIPKKKKENKSTNSDQFSSTTTTTTLSSDTSTESNEDIANKLKQVNRENVEELRKKREGYKSSGTLPKGMKFAKKTISPTSSYTEYENSVNNTSKAILEQLIASGQVNAQQVTNAMNGISSIRVPASTEQSNVFNSMNLRTPTQTQANVTWTSPLASCYTRQSPLVSNYNAPPLASYYTANASITSTPTQLLNSTFSGRLANQLSVPQASSSLIGRVRMVEFNMSQQPNQLSEMAKISMLTTTKDKELADACARVFEQSLPFSTYNEFVGHVLQTQSIEPVQLVKDLLKKADMVNTDYVQLLGTIRSKVQGKISDTEIIERMKQQMPNEIKDMIKSSLVTLQVANHNVSPEAALKLANNFRLMMAEGMKQSPGKAQSSFKGTKRGKPYDKPPQANERKPPVATSTRAAEASSTTTVKKDDGPYICYIHKKFKEKARYCKDTTRCSKAHLVNNVTAQPPSNS